MGRHLESFQMGFQIRDAFSMWREVALEMRARSFHAGRQVDDLCEAVMQWRENARYYSRLHDNFQIVASGTNWKLLLTSFQVTILIIRCILLYSESPRRGHDNLRGETSLPLNIEMQGLLSKPNGGYSKLSW